tara:strand:+ start:1112 stop:1603 length:492 start_codon:yes stop_codon:yes gene_type:complete
MKDDVKSSWSNRWKSPSADTVLTFDDIIKIIKKNNFHSIHIGTDSHIKKGSNGKHIFATVICLYEVGNGAFYYFSRETHKRAFRTLSDRIMEEASRSITLAQEIYVQFPNRKIVIHSDTNTDERYPTTKFTPTIRNWAKAIGVDFVAKPEAWAATSVADWHAK